MRHLGSLALGLLLAPLINLLAGTAAERWNAGYDEGLSANYGPIAVGVLVALVAGGLYGLLVLTRISPLGLIVAGLALLGFGLWSMVALRNFIDVVPEDVLDVAHPLAGPTNILLAVPLLLTVFSPRRWRRWGDALATVAPTPNYSPPPVPPYGYGSPPGSPVGYPSPWGGNDDPQETRRL